VVSAEEPFLPPIETLQSGQIPDVPLQGDLFRVSVSRKQGLEFVLFSSGESRAGLRQRYLSMRLRPFSRQSSRSVDQTRHLGSLSPLGKNRTNGER
jgi:hypothetical protein